jgi:hypothetical protein
MKVIKRGDYASIRLREDERIHDKLPK